MKYKDYNNKGNRSAHFPAQDLEQDYDIKTNSASYTPDFSQHSKQDCNKRYSNSTLTNQDVKDFKIWLKSDDGKTSIYEAAKREKEREKERKDLRRKTRELMDKRICI